MGTVPRLSWIHAGQLLNRAWGRVRDYRLWSFHVVPDAQIFVPKVITAGSITATFNSTTITTNTTAGPALNAVVSANPPLAGGIGVGRQLQIGASPAGPYYTIVSWVFNSPSTNQGTITIDKPYGEASVTNASYQCLKVYYAAPGFPYTSTLADPNLLRFVSIINRTNGYSFSGKNLNWSQEMLNAIDPQRGSRGDAYIQANYGRAPSGVVGIQPGTPLFELYPAPVNFTTYNATYVTRWPDLSVTQDLPQMPYGVAGMVLNKTKVYACRWALTNIATFSDLGGTNWVAAAGEYKEQFNEDLIQAIKMDDEIMPWPALRQGPGFSYPLGGQFLQSHDLSSIISGY